MSKYKPLITSEKAAGLKTELLYREAQPLKITKRSPEAWKTLLEQLPQSLTETFQSEFWETNEELVLSARDPVKPGRGHLVGLGVHSYYPTAPSLYYLNLRNDWNGYPPNVEVWLAGLDPQGIYIVELRVNVYGGPLRLQASSVDHADYSPGTFGDSIDVVIVRPKPAAPWLTGPVMSLLRLTPHPQVDSWEFHYARIVRVA